MAAKSWTENPRRTDHVSPHRRVVRRNGRKCEEKSVQERSGEIRSLFFCHGGTKQRAKFRCRQMMLEMAV